MAEDRKQTGIYSRKSLYEMVWKEPVEDIAKRIGLSGRGLAKLCERNSIPVPPRGYWQKKKAGQSFGPRPPLIELPGERFSHLDIAMRQAASSSIIQSNVRGEKSELLQFYAREAAVRRNIRIPKTLKSLHPVPAEWVRDTHCSLSLIENYKLLLSRTCKIYSGILSFAETTGFKVVDYPKPVQGFCVLSYQTARVAIEIAELATHSRRRVTVDEKAAAPWEAREWRQTKEPTGELMLTIGPEIRRYGSLGFPNTWHDDADGLLEGKLTAVFAGLVATVLTIQHDAAVTLAKEQETQRRTEAANERRREREKAEERKAKLRRDALAWREAADLRAFVAAVQSASEDHVAALPMALDEWVHWSLGVADEIDPLAIASEAKEP